MCSEAGIRSEQNHYGLTPVATIISERYEISQRRAGEPLIDFSAFDQAKAAARYVDDKLTEADLKEIGNAMEAGMGFRPETVGMVLTTISSWPEARPDNPVPVSTVDALVAACLDNFEEASRDQVLAAIRALTLNAENLASNPKSIEHWEQERRLHRIVTRPIIEVRDGTIRLLPWQANATWKIFRGYLAEGRCMWPLAALPTSVQEAMAAFRKQRNRDLELDAEREFKKVTPLVRRNVKKPKVLGLDPTKFHGEIDVLAVDEERGLIWVADAKDVFIPFSPSTLRSSYQKFYEDPNYVEKVKKKVASIATDPPSVARALGAQTPDREWTVRPLMVTRNVEPAAFAKADKIEFCSISELVDFLKRH